MKQIATTIEQSERLLKLRIKPETADMRYDIISESQIDGVAKVGYKKDVTTDCIPAWSLTALLDLIPIEIQTKTNYFTMQIDRERNGLYRISYEPFLIRNLYLISFVSTELIDAAVEMVEWLLENKYINNIK